MRTTVTAITCSLILGLSIGIGQSVAGPKAESSDNAAIVTQLKRIKSDTQSIENANDDMRETLGHRIIGHDDIRDLVERICENTKQSFGGC